MSTMVKIELKITNLNAAKKACEELGGVFELHTDKKMEEVKAGTRVASMKFKVSGIPITLVKDDNGAVDMQLDNHWSYSSHDKAVGIDGKRFKQEYAVASTIEAARKKGWTARRINLSDGRIKLVATGA